MSYTTPHPDLFVYSSTEDGLEIARAPETPARRVVRDTSRLAKQALAPGVVEENEASIMNALRSIGRLTRPELEQLTRISTQSITARLRALVEDGSIQMTNEKKPGPTGRLCRLYQLSPGGR